jgi:hypothetical protein
MNDKERLDKQDNKQGDKQENQKNEINGVDSYYIKELDPDIIWPTTATYRDKDQGGSKIIVVGKPGCFTKGTPILMYDGRIVNVENVQRGDRVMGPDSTPRTVLELCRNNDLMFKIVPEFGDSYTVNLEHKLVLTNINSLRSDIIEMTVREYLEQSDTWKACWFIFKTGVEFREKRLSDDIEILCIGTISNEVLYNSRNVREQALTFLKSHYNNRIPYREDTLYLLRSLGRRYRIDGNVIYEVNDQLKCRFIVEPQGQGDYYGFTLDGDHRFLLGTFDVVRNTGKSTLIGSLLYAKKHIFPIAMAMSGTEDSNHFYKSVLPSTFVFNNYDEEQIEKLIKRQKIAKEHVENPWCVMILDDCTDDPVLFRKPLQQGLYKRGRHWKMWYILSLQYGMDVRPVIRTNVDGVFILREPNLRNRKIMYENYGAIVPDFNLFCELLDQLTNDYTALYIHNTTRSNNWRDCVFWYKAKPIPKDFKFGCDEYWDFHYQRYNPEYVEPVTV